MTQGIIIDVAGEAAGVVNVPREFIYSKIDPTPPLVTLSMGEAATSYFWQIISQPVGASAVLSSTTAASPTFTPTTAVAGTYLIRCTLDGTTEYYENATAWKTEFRDFRIPAVTEASMYGSRGWDAAVEKFLRQIDINVEGPDGAVDNVVPRFNGTDGKTIEESPLVITGYDMTLYEAVNDGNPRYDFGSSATNRGTIQAVFDSGAQTLDYLLISTDSATGGDIVFNPKGNVGINNTSPQGLFHIDSSTGGAEMMRISRNSTTKGLRLLNYDGTTGVTAFALQSSNDLSAWDDIIRIKTSGANVGIGGPDMSGTPAVGKVTIKSSAGGNIFVGRNSSEVNTFVINEAGNVGIRTSSPAATLDIITSNVAVAPSTSGDDIAIRNAGNCGMSLLGGNGSNCKIVFGDEDDSDVGWIDYDNLTDTFSIRVNGTGDRLVISSAGDVGINTTDLDGTPPIGRLTVKSAAGGNSLALRDSSEVNRVVFSEDGTISVDGIKLNGQGTDIASANDAAAPDAHYCDVTGTTQINTMATTGWKTGDLPLSLKFDSNPVVKHATAGTGAQFQLAGSGDFSASAGDTLIVVYDGTYWREVSRTVI